MKILVLASLFITFESFGHTNYNTLLYQKKDSISKVDLHLKRSEQLSTLSTISHTTAIVTLGAFYLTSTNPKLLFGTAIVLCCSSITLKILSTKHLKKSKNYLYNR